MHKGWHERGYLPHFDAAGLVQHIAFRLDGSLPASVLERLKADSDYLDERRDAVDDALDRGMGPTWLADPICARLVAGALTRFDGQRYRLLAWCVMPNHVHVLIEQVDCWSLSALVKSWKSYTARMINRYLRRDGSFWAADYFDRYVRNAEQMTTTIRYIEANPVKAGLCREPQDWPWSSASRYAEAREPPGSHSN